MSETDTCTWCDLPTPEDHLTHIMLKRIWSHRVCPLCYELYQKDLSWFQRRLHLNRPVVKYTLMRATVNDVQQINNWFLCELQDSHYPDPFFAAIYEPHHTIVKGSIIFCTISKGGQQKDVPKMCVMKHVGHKHPVDYHMDKHFKELIPAVMNGHTIHALPFKKSFAEKQLEREAARKEFQERNNPKNIAWEDEEEQPLF